MPPATPYHPRAAWRERFAAQSSGGGVDERFLVVGEELHEPLELLLQRRLDGLWHESFKKYIRAALLGQNADDEPSFEWTVRKAIDCRTFGYSDGAQAVIYLCTGITQLGGAERETDAFAGCFLRRSDVGAQTRVWILQQRASQHHCP